MQTARLDVEPLALGLRWPQVEALKWIALVAMVCDHVNVYFFGGALRGWSELGRITFPLFALALALGVDETTHSRILRRLLCWGLLAELVCRTFQSEYTLNVMFTLASGVASVRLLLAPYGWRRAAALAGWLALGCVSEFGVVGYGLVVTLALYARTRRIEFGIAALWSLLCLVLPNDNWFALAAVIPVLAVRMLDIGAPRLRGFFYWFYPAHLAVVSVVRYWVI